MDYHGYLAQVASLPNTTWQNMVSMVSKQANVNAAQAAKMLEPYYRSVEELKLLNKWYSNSDVVNFVNEMGMVVQSGQLGWSDAVGHVARQLNVPVSEAAILLSDSVKHVY